MPNPAGNELLIIFLKEYEKLKDEQTQRIGFRDNMIYVTLVAVGGVISFAMGSPDKHIALLLVPWICLILGWTYLVNDEKISSVGKYIRTKLDERIRQQMNLSERVLLGWEVEHRSDKRRIERKLLQCFVDEMAFCLSGIGSVFVYLYVSQPLQSIALIICSFEIIFLVGLGIEFITYADLKQGRS
jgi:hypothetical protein